MKTSSTLSCAIMCIAGGTVLEAQAAAPVFTGHADTDFKIGDPQTILVSDNVGDVGVPAQCPTGTVSGFDMSGIWFYYDRNTDTVYVGMQTPQIFGDVDGDGNPSGTSACLNAAGGSDAADIGDFEFFALYIDTSGDGNPDVIIGKPASPGTSIANFTTATFSGSIITPATAFGSTISANVGTYYASPTASKPHMEFTIPNFTKLPGFKTGINPKTDAVSFAFGASGGSYQAAAFGQDYVPGAGVTKLATFPAPIIGTVTGSVFQDANGNGTKDTSETALSGMAVKLTGDTDGNGTSDTLNATSASDGSFSFTPLGANTYSVALTVPFGYTATNATTQSATITKTQTVALTPFGLKQADTDSDGIPDLVEGQGDPDGDTKPNYQDPDSDGDSIPDTVEAGPAPATPVNTDGDGKQDYLDTDSDNDSIPDSVEGTGDPDSDGIPNYRDLDSDGDSIPDSVELTGDPEEDSIPSYLDLDSDDDGLGDPLEAGSNPNVPVDTDGDDKPDYIDQDSDDDGLPDDAEGSIDTNGDGLDDKYIDTDSDGKPNAQDPDSDGDGINDGTEAGVTITTAIPDTDTTSPNFVPDASPSTTTNPLDKDTDDDGISDGTEDKNHNGGQDPTETRPELADTDGDGIQDGTELGYTSGTPDTNSAVFVPDSDPSTKTDPLDTDTDNGGMTDGTEDPNHNGQRDPLERDPLVGADDPDAELDGIPDSVEGTGDADNDGTPNYWDTDSDGDNIPDSVEAGSNPSTPVSTDPDGTPNYLDTDSDNDGLPDSTEAGPNPAQPVDSDTDGKQDSTDVDSDDDGVTDGQEPQGDHDGDGDVNHLDPDADNDGLLDGTEAGLTTPSPDTELDSGNFVPDADPSTKTDPVDADTDDDGLLDGTEDDNTNGEQDSTETNPLKDDSDVDGIQDGTESGLSTPELPETGANVNDTDPEVFQPDTDPSTSTDPLDKDTDDGGIPDGVEDLNSNGNIDANEIDPNDPSDDEARDLDNDGLPDLTEVEIGTNPNDVDSDDDGVPDGDEGVQDSDDDGKIDPLDPDSDNDGILDGTELGVTTPTLNTDTGVGNYVPDSDPSTTTDPRDADTDDDGLSDGQEDNNLNGRTDSLESNPLAPDTDDDGLQDGTEAGLTLDDIGPDTQQSQFVPDSDPTTTTSALDDDHDDDGLLDGNEDANHNGKIDSGETDPRNANTDNDCLQDGTEQGLVNPQGDDTLTQVFVPDNDPSSTTDPLSADSDGGGKVDGGAEGEDLDCDGLVESGETDPNVPSDDTAVEESPTPSPTPGDDELGLQGGGGCRGCSSTGTDSQPGALASLLLSLGVLGLHRRKRRSGSDAVTSTTAAPRASDKTRTRIARWFGLGTVAVAATASTQAQAADATAPKVDVQQFHPTADLSGSLMTSGSSTLSSGGYTFAIWGNYSHNPLVVVSGGDILYPLQSSVLGVDLAGAVSLLDGMQVEVNVPATAFQVVATDTPFSFNPASSALSDISLGLKWRLVDGQKSPFGLALAPQVFIPSGSPESYTGGLMSFSGSVLLDTKLKNGAWIGANLGYRYRSDAQSLANLTVDDELVYRLGASIPAGPGTITADLFGRVGVQAVAGGDVAEVPLELMVGLARPVSKNLTLNLGLSTGLVAGYGTPDYRIAAGLSWGVRSNDRDEDGLADSIDQCPNEPEDKDSFQDSDGCPDPDNDGDGILDINDRCPNVAEDKDGFQDNDGCVDPDNDGDGLGDLQDRCPNDPEDRDGFEDSEGCPDPDNDHDGLPDANDRCPNEPEDQDGFQDNDGCPDPDNDGDGLADLSDRCPNDPETLNSFEDEDGCPDIKPTKNVKSEGGKLVLLEKIYFALDKADIKPQSFKILDEAVSVFKDNANLRIRIEGHTDDQGSDEHNLDLSQRRADSVKTYLVTHGIDAARIVTRGFGETQPIVPNINEENRAKNRRIEWVILTENTPSVDP